MQRRHPAKGAESGLNGRLEPATCPPMLSYFARPKGPMLTDNLVGNHRVLTLPPTPRINGEGVQWRHAEPQQNPMRGHCLLRTASERRIVQYRLEKRTCRRWVQQPQRDGNLGRNETAREKSVAQIIVELASTARQETSATSQAMPPTGLSKNLRAVSRIGSEHVGDATINLQIVLNTLVAPNKIQRVQIVRNALAIRTQPIKDSPVCHLWCWRRHGA